MSKNIIIEKNDLILLPEAYSVLGKEYTNKFNEIEKKTLLMEDLLEKAYKLKMDCNSLIQANKIVYNKLKFIKRNYVPKSYLKCYRKNNNPQYYVHVVVNYLDYSKTIYLGKRDDLINLFSSKIKLLNKRNFNSKMLNFLSPIIKSYCFKFNSQSDFIASKFKYKSLFDKVVIPNDDRTGFNDFLKSLSKS